MMNKKTYFTTLIVLTIFVFAFNFNTPSVSENFDLGESYDYKVKYGFLTIGGADVDVDDNLYSLNGKICYRVNVVGKTAGITDMFKVRNTYRSYIDTAAFVPHKFIYSAREQSYKRDQVINFDQNRHEAVKIEKEEAKTFKVPSNIHDVISGYYYLRTIDFSRLSIGQTVSAPVFFDEDHFMMRVKYAGKGTIKTRFGRINVLKLNPILPKNDLFKDENAIRIWVSDDKNRVPVKIEADFKFGTIDMELNKYRGVKYPFRWS